MAAAQDLEEELNCSICLSIYTDPVLLGCGHNFCRECIEQVFDNANALRNGYFCPECKTFFQQKPVLQKNFKLYNIVERFAATQLTQATSILCDFCLSEPLIAIKTCVNCEASLCMQHLRKHSEKATRKNHVLVEPTNSLAKRKCSEHGKLIEYYCNNDKTCICVTCCVAGPHKGHNIETLKNAYAQKLGMLAKHIESLQIADNDVQINTEELQTAETKLKGSSSVVRKKISDLFQEIKTQVDKEEKQIMEIISSSELAQLSKLQNQIQDSEKKRTLLMNFLRDAQALKGEKDALRFIQNTEKCT
uniref:RING-type domain-containing protein n=1 Tax=Latimeria chalumnae TaxID=7897 RepID=H3AUH9_LATCH